MCAGSAKRGATCARVTCCLNVAPARPLYRVFTEFFFAFFCLFLLHGSYGNGPDSSHPLAGADWPLTPHPNPLSDGDWCVDWRWAVSMGSDRPDAIRIDPVPTGSSFAFRAFRQKRLQAPWLAEKQTERKANKKRCRRYRRRRRCPLERRRGSLYRRRTRFDGTILDRFLFVVFFSFFFAGAAGGKEFIFVFSSLTDLISASALT